MRVIDFSKVAATFVDTRNLRAVRVVPRRGVRERARVCSTTGASGVRNSMWKKTTTFENWFPTEASFYLDSESENSFFSFWRKEDRMGAGVSNVSSIAA
jgi:hypothetical protein